MERTRPDSTRPGPIFRPDVDIVEQADRFLVTADLPGVDQDHIRVNLAEGVLSIDAEQSPQVEPTWSAVYTEYRPGSYHREFRLSDKIDVDQIAASMRDGVLELTLPKAEPHRPRRITVESV